MSGETPAGEGNPAAPAASPPPDLRLRAERPRVVRLLFQPGRDCLRLSSPDRPQRRWALHRAYGGRTVAAPVVLPVILLTDVWIWISCCMATQGLRRAGRRMHGPASRSSSLDQARAIRTGRGISSNPASWVAGRRADMEPAPAGSACNWFPDLCALAARLRPNVLSGGRYPSKRAA